MYQNVKIYVKIIIFLIFAKKLQTMFKKSIFFVFTLFSVSVFGQEMLSVSPQGRVESEAKYTNFKASHFALVLPEGNFREGEANSMISEEGISINVQEFAFGYKIFQKIFSPNSEDVVSDKTPVRLNGMEGETIQIGAARGSENLGSQLILTCGDEKKSAMITCSFSPKISAEKIEMLKKSLSTVVYDEKNRFPPSKPNFEIDAESANFEIVSTGNYIFLNSKKSDRYHLFITNTPFDDSKKEEMGERFIEEKRMQSEEAGLLFKVLEKTENGERSGYQRLVKNGENVEYRAVVFYKNNKINLVGISDEAASEDLFDIFAPALDALKLD